MTDRAYVRGRLSDAERLQIQQLAARGLTAGQIAQRLERHPATINFYMVTHGLRAPVDRTRAYARGTSAVRTFSADEDAFITVLRCQSYKYREIAAVCAQRFGHRRTPAVIGIRLRMLASRDEAMVNT